MHPIEQFEIRTLFPIVKIGNVEIAFTNSALYMLIAVAIIALLMIGFTSRKALVPGRLQAIAEISYEFIAANLQRSAGSEGMKFFPLVFSLFMFILVLNVISLIPHTFAVTAQIIITASLAMLVFLTVIVYGFWKHGFRFLRVFVPSGVPVYLLPLVSTIEVLSFLSRPLFAQRSLVRQHPCRPYNALRVRRLRHHGERARHPRLVRSHRPAGHDSNDLRA